MQIEEKLDLPWLRGHLILEVHHDMDLMLATQQDMTCDRSGVARQAEWPSSGSAVIRQSSSPG